MKEEIKEFIKDLFEEIPEGYGRPGKYYTMCGILVTLHRLDAISDNDYNQAKSNLSKWMDSEKEINGEEIWRY